MKRFITIAICLFSLQVSAQEILKNALSTSLICLEDNSQTTDSEFELKFMTGIEYQRFVNRWSFGFKYEHGLNKIEEDPEFCFDCFYGTGYIREDNIYLTSNYSILQLFHSRLMINTGLGFYYSNLNFSGVYQGGISGSGARKNTTYNTFGLAPGISLVYFPTNRLFLSLNSNFRFGLSNQYDAIYNLKRKSGEIVTTAPEFKIGVKF